MNIWQYDIAGGLIAIKTAPQEVRQAFIVVKAAGTA
jgi:hypothetical protein